MEFKMRGLKICLWATGIMCLLSVAGLFLPLSALQSVAAFFGVDTLPDLPWVMYGARIMSATFIGIGVFFIILAMDPMKYGVMVPFSGLAAVVIAVVCLITGLMVKMPAIWFLGDTLSCAIPGILILFFWQRAKKATSAVS